MYIRARLRSSCFVIPRFKRFRCLAVRCTLGLPLKLLQFSFPRVHTTSSPFCVSTVPDRKLGEELCAWIKLRATHAHVTADEIRAHCRANIAHFKCPRYIRFVTDFPMTVSGKPQKFLMRASECQALGLQEQKTA